MNATRLKALSVLTLLVAPAATPAIAQDIPRQVDALTASPNNFRLIVENDQVRVLEYNLLPGQKDRRHTHPQRVAHVIAEGKLRVGFPDGTHKDFDEIAGTSEWNGPAPLHDTQNIGSTPIKILLVEVKQRPR